MDTLLIVDCGRGTFRVYYNGLRSRAIPEWRVEYYMWRAMNVYHRRWGVGR